MSTIYEIFGRDAHAMTIALMERAEVITAIPAGASVALKPNLVVAGQPEYGATTHAGVLSGAIEYLREHGVRDISIIEGSWVGGQHRPGLPRRRIRRGGEAIQRAPV